MARHRRVAAIDVESAITEELQKYGRIANDVLKDSIAEVAYQAEARLQSVTKFAPKGHPTGQYAADWDVTREESGFKSSAIVHNIDHYRLTHLLEFGHVTRNGSDRTFDRTPAYPHIAPVNDWAQEEVIRQIERRLGNI